MDGIRTALASESASVPSATVACETRGNPGERRAEAFNWQLIKSIEPGSYNSKEIANGAFLNRQRSVHVGLAECKRGTGQQFKRQCAIMELYRNRWPRLTGLDN